MAEKDTKKASESDSKDSTDDTTPSRDTEGVKNDKDAVSGQNSPSAVVEDERNIKEQGEALAREAEAGYLDPDGAAGDDYLYPDLPVSAQNPPKRAVIAYKHDPKDDSSN